MDRFARDDISAAKLACVFVLTAACASELADGGLPLMGNVVPGPELTAGMRVLAIAALCLIAAWFGSHRLRRFDLALACSGGSFAAIGALMVCAGAAHAEAAGIGLLLDLFGCGFLVLNAVDARHDAMVAERVLSRVAGSNPEVVAARRALGVDADGKLP